MEISTFGRREETYFDDDWRLMIFTWNDNEWSVQILDDSYSEMKEQQTDPVEHIDPIDYSDSVEHKDISSRWISQSQPL